MTLRRAYTAAEYAEWVKQAVFESKDLRACLEYDLEEMQRLPSFLDPLEQSINDLFTKMKNGNYQFERSDLVFMDLVRRYGDEIPFSTLLKQINETHKYGLDIDPTNPTA
ncbi:general secretion pathway protein GspF [Achromatium sp. WMS2]|nr:general secretion pathway protein GspF [Achromatium sp. WMS2]